MNQQDETHEHWTREEALEFLRAASGDGKKIKEWNGYREKHPDWIPDLSDFDHPCDMQGFCLWFIDLHKANLRKANLEGAELEYADLSNAELGGVNLSNVKLSEVDLSNASLNHADLSNAKLRLADLSGADLWRADITGADLSFVNLTNANVAGIRYDRKRMQNCFLGIRGLDSCYSNALFVRDARDQDYIDSLYSKWEDKRAQHKWKIGPMLMLFGLRLWGWIDYGRAMLRTAGFAVLFAIAFGFAYLLWPGMLHHEAHTPENWFRPFYYSIVTYTTLGFGDVTPQTLAGQIVVTIEVILGYVTLGLLISILGNKVARRA